MRIGSIVVVSGLFIGPTSAIFNDLNSSDSISHDILWQLVDISNNTQVQGNSRNAYAGKYLKNFDTFDIDVRNPEDRLDKLINTLKTFVKDTQFSMVSFEAREGDLRNELWNIESAIRRKESRIFSSKSDLSGKLPPRPAPLAKRLQFADYMFKVMEDSIEQLKFYNNMESVEQHLIRCLIQLNVKLLMLRNSQGEPDANIPGYNVAIHLNSQYLEFWSNLYRSLGELPSSIVMKFGKMYRQASLTLQVLKTFTM